MSVRKGNKIIAGSYAVVKPEVYTKVETDDLLNQKQDKLIAGNNIFIDENNVISSSGGSGSFINVVQETGDSTEDVMSQASVTYELEQKANTIDLADVSLSGDYEDLSNTPDLSVYTKTEDLAEIAFTADYEDLGNTPDLTLYAKNEELSKVATTNNYNDLDNKPNLELYDTTISVNNKLSLKQDLLTAGEGISIEGNTISSTVNSAEWGNIIGDITNQADLQERLNGKLGIDFDNITEEGVKNLANIIGTGDYMFDTRLVDHELTYEETKGWALQGTYVYKEAVAGSRYGYPDFYNKCVEEFENSVFDKPNVNIIGSLVNNSGVLSGFSSDSYAKLPVSFNPESNSWEIVFKARTGSVFEDINIMFYSKSFAFQTHSDGKLRLFLGSNGSSYDIASAVVGNSVLTINTLYNFKVEFTGTQYKAYYSTTDTFGEPDITVDSTVNIYPSTICIGLNDSSFSYPWTDSIDLSDAYININGERWWSGNLIYKNPNGHLFYDIANKTQVDEAYVNNGIAWYYGIDKENERIFLPRTKWFIQPTGEITEVNTVNEAGLPNITGSGILFAYKSYASLFEGALSGQHRSNVSGVGGGSLYGEATVSFDASLSNPIYGNSDTVQPPSINQLLYICVGNTNVESAVTDVVDVTTTENDTVPLGYSTYQNGIVPNTSWLKSEGQWNDGNVYTTFYNEFVQKIGLPFASGYVKEITDEYDDYDLVINQDDMTFRLPLLDGSESVIDYSNGIDISGYTSSSNQFVAPCNGVIYWGSLSNADAYINGVTVGSNQGDKTFGGNNITCFLNAGQMFYATEYNDNTTICNRFFPFKGNGSLYFKVANAVQNLELLDAGEVLESLADKISRQDCKAYVTETYQNGTSWYRVYSDGWCEQGGTVPEVDTTNVQVTFLKPFINTNFSLISTDCQGEQWSSSTANANANQVALWSAQLNRKSTTGFFASRSNPAHKISWEAKGYIS